jgi:cytochrome c oxidase assembly protein subunit 15
MTAFVDVVLIGLLALVAWRGYRGVPRVAGPAIGSAGLVVAQAVLGGIVVRGDLSALLVTAHFATAMVLVATLVNVTVASFTLERRRPGPPDRLAESARRAAALALGLLVVGAYVRGEGAGLAFVDWPLMSGRVIPGIHGRGQALMFTHRILALVVGVAIALLLARAWQQRGRRSVVFRLSIVAAGLYLAQVLIGAANVWSRLAQPAVVAHVTVSSLIWGALVAATATARATQSDWQGIAGRHEAAVTASGVRG